MVSLPLFEDRFLERASRKPRDIVTASGRRLRTTAAFDSYWHFATERQAMLFRRLRGDATLTRDPILRSHRFTNAYRAADRVTQFFIREVAPGSEPDADDVVFRTLLFKIFNRIETWTSLELVLGEQLHWRTFSFERYDCALNRLQGSSQSIYSNAYIMPSPSFGHRAKHSNHLELISSIIRAGLPTHISEAPTLAAVYSHLKDVPSFGPFLAFQYAIDMNYTDLLDFSEADFVVPGPGALDGIRKCFFDTDGYGPADVIRIMTEIAPAEMERAGLAFISLWGRPLHLIDCQNLFCEVDKYSRVAHPELNADRGRSRIKQRYAGPKGPLPAFVFPKRWNVDASQPFGDVTTLV
jgi:hypothetical protein